MSFLLERLVKKVPGTHSALLLSTDGLRESWYGIGDDDADHLAAIASGVCSMAQAVGTGFSPVPEDGLRQMIVELQGLVMFVTAPAERTVLAVLANPQVDAKAVSYEMGRLSTQLRQQLATPARDDGPAQMGTR
ncbi:roadblock/LC7 domain-containing protein [Amycolatopsis sp. NPDC023774]|uniref:roadblock/LC7 domain-containing protein n=1 Tax=Amycolatopsis sp. NPDC023774 TaxID=3155015 RepID=UPI0033EB7636